MKITKILNDSVKKTFKYEVFDDELTRVHKSYYLMFKGAYDEMVNKILHHVYHLDEVQVLVNKLDKKTSIDILKIVEKNELFQKLEDIACYLCGKAPQLSDLEDHIEITCTEDQIDLIEECAKIYWKNQIKMGRIAPDSNTHREFQEMILSRKN